VRAPDENCTCPTVGLLHKFARHEDCEYYEHHCPVCHESGHCTLSACAMFIVGEKEKTT
jgi:hypothetical protein